MFRNVLKVHAVLCRTTVLLAMPWVAAYSVAATRSKQRRQVHRLGKIHEKFMMLEAKETLV